MTDKITEPVTPDVLNPSPLGPLSGDWKDDDADAYEADFRPNDPQPAKAYGLPHTKVELPPTNRLLVRTVNIGTVGTTVQDPIQLLPADLNRKSLTVQAFAANKPYVIASSKSDCYSGAQLTTTSPVANLVLDGYTGALWAYSSDAATIPVTVIAVTL